MFVCIHKCSLYDFGMGRNHGRWKGFKWLCFMFEPFTFCWCQGYFRIGTAVGKSGCGPEMHLDFGGCKNSCCSGTLVTDSCLLLLDVGRSLLQVRLSKKRQLSRWQTAMLPLSNDWLLFLRFKHKDQTTLWNFDLSTALKKNSTQCHLHVYWPDDVDKNVAIGQRHKFRHPCLSENQVYNPIFVGWSSYSSTLKHIKKLK